MRFPWPLRRSEPEAASLEAVVASSCAIGVNALGGEVTRASRPRHGDTVVGAASQPGPGMGALNLVSVTS